VLQKFQLHNFTYPSHFFFSFSDTICVLFRKSASLKQICNKRMASDFQKQNSIRTVSNARLYKPLPFLSLLQWYDFCPFVEFWESETNTLKEQFLIFINRIALEHFQLHTSSISSSLSVVQFVPSRWKLQVWNKHTIKHCIWLTQSE
jgi:hypothetical protein